MEDLSESQIIPKQNGQMKRFKILFVCFVSLTALLFLLGLCQVIFQDECERNDFLTLY